MQNFKELTKGYMYGPKRGFIVIFWILGLRAKQKKTFKSHLGGTEVAVHYGTKTNLVKFLLAAKAKIQLVV